MARFTKGKRVRDMSVNYNPTDKSKPDLDKLKIDNVNLYSEKERFSMTNQSAQSSGKVTRGKTNVQE